MKFGRRFYSSLEQIYGHVLDVSGMILDRFVTLKKRLLFTDRWHACLPVGRDTRTLFSKYSSGKGDR